MASPFHVFRKYQKTLLVVAGVLLMFVFVIGDSLMGVIGGGASRQTSGGRNPAEVAVRWDQGKLTNAELSQMVHRRGIVSAFLQRIEFLGRQAVFNSGNTPLPLEVDLVAQNVRHEDGVERDVLRTRLFADAARDIGMRISDENIRHYLHQVGRGLVSASEMRSIITAMQSNLPGASIDYIFEGLREELLARNFISSYQFAFESQMPEQRWRDWLRVNDQVVVEAAAIPARQFVIDVPDPDEAQLIAFFEEHKDREQMPDRVDNTELPSPRPGFATPRRIQVQFLRADFDEVLTQVADEITDAEIEAYYEQNKDPQFIRADSGFAAEDALLEADEPADDETAGDAEAASEDQTSEDEMTDEAASDETAEDEPLSQGDDEQAAPAQDEATEAEEAPSEDEPEIRGQSPDDDNDPLPSDEDAADSSEASGEQSTEDDTADNAAEEAGEDQPVEFQSLDEVRDEIRLQLARGKVADRLDEKMTQLRAQLSKAWRSWSVAAIDAEEEGKERPEPPPELADLTPLAEEHGLVAQKTGNLSFLELRETPLGRSMENEEYQAALANVLFARGPSGIDVVELYKPVTSLDVDNNRYLAIKVSDTPRNVPELDEVRDQVVEAWKMQEAAKLALERAKELADEAGESGLPLTQFFADQEIETTTTDPFSWLTIGDVSRTTGMVYFRLSEPEGIEAAGPAIMEEVFTLDSGAVGAQLNHDHSIAYVLRVVEHLSSRDELRRDFLAEADRWYGLQSMLQHHMQAAARALVSDLMASSGVDWQRTPDEIVGE